MKLTAAAIFIIGMTILTTCQPDAANSHTQSQLSSVRVTTPDQIKYEPLNPARGDASPQAGVLWGNIRENVPSGVLLKFAEGFTSPPHIHNITYRAIVIEGEIHNDDPDAINMWMGPGTFWTQPAGEIHITSAKPGVGGVGFLEILEGPYLVQPSEMAFDNGEKPLNMTSSNMVWMSADQFAWIQTQRKGAEVALLWRDMNASGLTGSMLKLTAGFEGTLLSLEADIKVVAIQGEFKHFVDGLESENILRSGGFFSSDEGVTHSLSCQQNSDCLLYIRTAGQFRVG